MASDTIFLCLILIPYLWLEFSLLPFALKNDMSPHMDFHHAWPDIPNKMSYSQDPSENA